MKKNQYVILTGGINNAGDHLIKHRAKLLFTWLKPDRKIIDLDGWKKLSNNDLKTINESKALMLVGGPALQNRMYPRVYALRENLDEIQVPIITMGIGWNSLKGNWNNTHNYKLNTQSKKLIERIDQSGYLSSVRDYHTLNVLHSIGMKNFLMTGCPALYSMEHLNSNLTFNKKIQKIGYSLGVSMKTSNKMFRQMQNILLITREAFPEADIDVVFHHSPTEKYLQTYGANKLFYRAQIQYLKWLEQNGFNYVDISGSAENLINYYSGVDLHIGYRVHAHIFMSSISKPSILLNEDGRGKALEKVIGGLIFNAYDDLNDSLLVKVLHKLSIKYDNYKDNPYLAPDIKNAIMYELKHGIKFSQPRVEIDRHFKVMKKFIEQLP